MPALASLSPLPTTSGSGVSALRGCRCLDASALIQSRFGPRSRILSQRSFHNVSSIFVVAIVYHLGGVQSVWRLRTAFTACSVCVPCLRCLQCPHCLHNLGSPSGQPKLSRASWVSSIFAVSTLSFATAMLKASSVPKLLRASALSKSVLGLYRDARADTAKSVDNVRNVCSALLVRTLECVACRQLLDPPPCLECLQCPGVDIAYMACSPLGCREALQCRQCLECLQRLYCMRASEVFAVSAALHSV